MSPLTWSQSKFSVVPLGISFFSKVVCNVVDYGGTLDWIN